MAEGRQFLPWDSNYLQVVITIASKVNCLFAVLHNTFHPTRSDHKPYFVLNYETMASHIAYTSRGWLLTYYHNHTAILCSGWIRENRTQIASSNTHSPLFENLTFPELRLHTINFSCHCFWANGITVDWDSLLIIGPLSRSVTLIL